MHPGIPGVVPRELPVKHKFSSLQKNEPRPLHGQRTHVMGNCRNVPDVSKKPVATVPRTIPHGTDRRLIPRSVIRKHGIAGVGLNCPTRNVARVECFMKHARVEPPAPTVDQPRLWIV